MTKEKLILGLKEHQLLEKHYKTSVLSDYNKQKLMEELKHATIIKTGSLPENVIGLYTHVVIEDMVSKKTFSFQIVPLEEANMKAHKISVFSPMAIAVLGYQEGSQVSWEMPGGLQNYLIKKVSKLN
ncbi:GreA/GreB family elongation factor [Pedobacter glucosidilyticus]|uniref:GreA/GreB family elongation factor n=1 Tax=Pedobacter glucosidilyticus TaxID=1122941 RepID=UPI00042408E9|nr:GreA/GreB family elongation factor [Pedobacter glucosidilyticus]